MLIATVDISPLYATLNQFLGIFLQGLAVVAVSYVTYLIRKWFGVSLDTSAATSINRGLQNGVAIAMQKIEDAEAVHKDINVKNAIVADAASYAMSHESDAVARLGLDPAQLANKALAYIPPPPGTAAVIAAPIKTAA